MRAFIVTFLIVLIIAGGAAWWLYTSAERLPEGSIVQQAGQALHADDPLPAAREPLDYHILEDQGGVPLEEARRAGLTTDSYAYLFGLDPIQISDGVEQLSGLRVRGRSYDLCYRFNTTTPQEQYLEYNLNGAWGELHFGVGFDDAHPSDPQDRWAIEFEIKGDADVLFGPEQVKPTGEPVFTSISLQGVNRLTIISRRVGHQNTFAPVLLDPFLKKTSQQPSE